MSRCGQVMTVSSGSFWTRTTASCLTRASNRYGRADIGTRCLSISVRRAGSTGTTVRGSGGVFTSVIEWPHLESAAMLNVRERVAQATTKG